MKYNIPYNTVIDLARRFTAKIYPHCKISSIAGSLRRGCLLVGDIEIVCVPKEEDSLDIFFGKDFPGIKINGHRLKRFFYPKSKLQIELYITKEWDYGRILAIRTGSSAFSHSYLAVQWNRLGWCGTEDGLRRKKECEHKGKSKWVISKEYKNNPTIPPPFFTEESFFEFLQVKYIEPENRNWISSDANYNYSL